MGQNIEIVKLQIKRGPEAQLPTLDAGEPAITTDTHKIFIGDGAINHELAHKVDLDATNVSLADNASQLERHGVSLEKFPIILPEVDDTARMQRWIASTNTTNNGILFIPKGNYTVTGIINVPLGVSIIGAGKFNVTINRTDLTERVFTLNGNQTVQGIGFNAKIALQTFGNDITIFDCKFTGGTQSIYIASTVRNITITHCLFDGNTYSILANTVVSYDVKISNCHFKNTTSGDFIEINAPVENWLIENCTFRDNTVTAAVSGFGIGIAVQAKGVLINNCSFFNIAGQGVHVEDYSEAIISNCTFKNCGADTYGGSPKADVSVLSNAKVLIVGCRFRKSDTGYSTQAVYNSDGSGSQATIKSSEIYQKYVGVSVSAFECDFYGDSTLAAGSRVGTGVDSPKSSNFVIGCRFSYLSIGVKFGWMGGGSSGGTAKNNIFYNCDYGIDGTVISSQTKAGASEIVDANTFDTCVTGIRLIAGSDQPRRDYTVVNNTFKGCTTNSLLTSSLASGYVRVVRNNRVVNSSTSDVANTSQSLIVGEGITGTMTYNGDGTSTSKTIAHGLPSTPSYFHVERASLDAGNAGIKYVTADVTNITVNFNTAPISGTNNVVLKWKAEL